MTPSRARRQPRFVPVSRRFDQPDESPFFVAEIDAVEHPA